MSVEIIARRYATALADVVVPSGEAENVKAELADWSAMIDANGDLTALLANPPEQVALDEEGRLRTWAKMTPHASVGSICAENFVPFFEDALSTILELCESFVPPG